MIKQVRKASSMMHRQVKRYAFVAVVVVAIALSGGCSGGGGAKKPKGPITAATFPDATFSAYVMENFDKDKDGIISDEEAAKAESISIIRGEVTSLEGIAVFSNLVTLECRSTQLTTLDVSTNTALLSLDCRYNKLTTLDVSKNTVLTYLNCDYNFLTALDVSNNTALEELWCESDTPLKVILKTGQETKTHDSKNITFEYK